MIFIVIYDLKTMVGDDIRLRLGFCHTWAVLGGQCPMTNCYLHSCVTHYLFISYLLVTVLKGLTNKVKSILS